MDIKKLTKKEAELKYPGYEKCPNYFNTGNYSNQGIKKRESWDSKDLIQVDTVVYYIKNIKKTYESKIMDFQTYTLNERKKELPYIGDTSGNIAELDIEQIVSGKLKPIEVSPCSSKDKTTLLFPEPTEKEGGDRHEEAILYLPNDVSFFINFTWSYDFKKGMKGDRLTPDDSDEYILTDLDIESVTYYHGKDGEIEMKIEVTPKIQSELKKYLAEFLPVD